ncbi:hypothetical protein KDN24_11755 [Bacillus sp. Bva_UNVM-123]|uniref:hypothetical protein n=1 Tax=Bacillus sp. Bva_UNVM-123 TaxID=2829798 RepID=UPI00391FB2C8
MKLKFFSTTLSHLDKNIRILKPEVELKHTYVLETAPRVYIIFGTEEELNILAHIIYLANFHKNYLFYLPLRKNVLTPYLKNWSHYVRNHDLVLLHHSVQFQTKQWKTIRNSINKSLNETTLEVDLPKTDKVNRLEDFMTFYHNQNKDYLDLKNYAETLFLVGSKKVFYHITIDVKEISDNGKQLYEKHPGWHEHEHLDSYIRFKYLSNKGNGYSLTVDFYDEDLWGANKVNSLKEQ